MKINHSKDSDKIHKRTYKEEDYISGTDLLALREQLHNKCKYCYTPLQTDNMQAHDGLTIERLDNKIAHVKGNCTLACSKCNIKRMGVKSKNPTIQKEHAEYLKKRRTENIVREILDEILLNVARLTVNSICGECVDG